MIRITKKLRVDCIRGEQYRLLAGTGSATCERWNYLAIYSFQEYTPTNKLGALSIWIQSGDDIGIEVYWKYKDPLVWFDEFVKQLDRLFVIKEWNNNRLHPRIPITIRPKQI